MHHGELLIVIRVVLHAMSVQESLSCKFYNEAQIARNKEYYYRSNLKRMHMRGTIPNEIGYFKHLESLYDIIMIIRCYIILL
jgi:hypothetical protein